MTISGTANVAFLVSRFDTQEVGNPTSSIALYVLPAAYSWGESWQLKKDLYVEVRSSRERVLAVTNLTVEEFGEGTSFEEAALDLLTSLKDYHDSLTEREGRLAPQGVEDLRLLRSLMGPLSTG